ncbi:MAG TPA: formate--tetrahydrofolate ligase, partial [Nitrospirae bacterium]|nr:formate--tetrahydrofolate ligase [Nitrospirota bacterium]
VAAACEEKTEFKFLYELDQPVKDRIELIAKEVYGADGVEYSPEANASLARIQKDPELSKLGLCMVKTHLSLSDNPSIKGVPTGWKLKIREVLTYGGARFIVPVAGAISLMPGTGSNPAFRRVDVDTETGKVQGVF